MYSKYSAFGVEFLVQMSDSIMLFGTNSKMDFDLMVKSRCAETHDQHHNRY